MEDKWWIDNISSGKDIIDVESGVTVIDFVSLLYSIEDIIKLVLWEINNFVELNFWEVIIKMSFFSIYHFRWYNKI